MMRMNERKGGQVLTDGERRAIAQPAINGQLGQSGRRTGRGEFRRFTNTDDCDWTISDDSLCHVINSLSLCLFGNSGDKPGPALAALSARCGGMRGIT